MKPIDITNQKFGKLTALYVAGKNSAGNAIWHCKCDCGNETDVIGSLLRNKTIDACPNCRVYKERKYKTKRGNIEDLTGQKFGKLTVVSFDKTENGKTYWNCKCDCGNDYTTRATYLKQGMQTSCGCDKPYHAPYREYLPRNLDLTGKKFGRLTVIGKAEGKKKWKCQCDCGNIAFFETHSLVDKLAQSCGCQKSRGKSRGSRDLTGLKFGKLTVLIKSSETDDLNEPMWICQCSCGKIITTKANSLIRGNVDSCEDCIENHVLKADEPIEVGTKVGKLEVIRKSPTKCHGLTMWVCKCKCGHSISLTEKGLRSNKVTSCGKCLENEKI